MADKIIKARIQQKHDVEANWIRATAGSGFIPRHGEIIIYDAETELSEEDKGLLKRNYPIPYNRYKIGDGDSDISELPFEHGVGLEGESHSEIFNDYENNSASGEYAHAEGSSTTASGIASHAEGGETTASGEYSHAGGTRSVASHVNAFAHGNNVKSSADDSAVFGKWNEGDSNNIFEVGVGTDDTNRKNGLSVTADGQILDKDGKKVANEDWVSEQIANIEMPEGSSGVGQATPEGGEIFNDYTNNQATGNYSHASGHGTKATTIAQTAIGEYNATDDSAALLVGNGTSDSKRSNAFKVLKDGSAVIGEGETSGKGSIAAGTTDKALAESIVGSTLASMVTLTPAKALAPLTIAYGANSSSVVPGAITLGVENVSGVKGYYWDTIDFTNKKIKLSSTRRTTTLKNPTYITSLDWAVGDVISIVNDKFYSGQIKITAIDAQNSTITVDSLPFTEIAYTSTLTVYTYDSPMDRTIYATYQRDKSSLSNKVKPLWASRNGTVNIGLGPMSLGIMNLATGSLSFVTGQDNWAAGESSAASGLNTQAIGNYSHAEGYKAVAQGLASHAEGSSTASGEKSHAEGGGTKAIGIYSHSEGISAGAQGHADHAEGDSTVAYGHAAHAEGKGTTARNIASHAEGNGTQATANMSHAEGNSTTASGVASHAEGSKSIARGIASHAEGDLTQASHDYTHAEGAGAKATQPISHAEGLDTLASAKCAHAQGWNTTASGEASHAGGYYSTASHNYSIVHGRQVKSGAIAGAYFGKFNVGNESNIFEIGIGTSDTARKNGVSVSTTGNMAVSGTITSNGQEVATKAYVDDIAITGGTGDLSNYYTKSEVDGKVKATQQSSAAELFITGCGSNGIAKMPYGRARITGDAAPFIDMGGGYKVNGTTVIDSEFIGGFWRGESMILYNNEPKSVSIKPGCYYVQARYNAESSEVHILRISEHGGTGLIEFKFYSPSSVNNVAARFSYGTDKSGIVTSISTVLLWSDLPESTDFEIFIIRM